MLLSGEEANRRRDKQKSVLMRMHEPMFKVRNNAFWNNEIFFEIVSCFKAQTNDKHKQTKKQIQKRKLFQKRSFLK